MQPKKPARQARRRTTRFSVRLGEFLSTWIITVGGIGTIIAVIAVAVFLVWVAVPLFSPSSLSATRSVESPTPDVKLLRSGVDEYQLLAWALYADGTLTVSRLDTGKVLEQKNLFADAKLTACSAPSADEEMAFGFADGKIRLGRISFATRFLKDKEIPSELRDLAPGAVAEFDAGMVSRMPGDVFRGQKIHVEIEEPVKSDNTSPVVLIDQSIRPTGPVLSVLTADGMLRTTAVSKREDILTGEVFKELEGGELRLPPEDAKHLPAYLLLSGVGDNVFLTWEDGRTIRVSTRKIDNPVIVEDCNLLGTDGAKLTALQFLIGKTTLLAGDSNGRVRAWFRVHRESAATGDRNVMAEGHDFVATGSPVTTIAPSERSRMAAVGYQDGRIRLYFVTSEKMLVETTSPHSDPIRSLLIAPKDDGIVVRTSAEISQYQLNSREHHPEVTLRSITLPVWYEGADKPAYVWQATGSDQFEPKFGLWPLVFGTLKATFYAMLLGVPLALLAAIYTSEFLHPSAKAVIKPTIELMASLPSVVLGFLAALVLAPFIERWLAVVLAAPFTVPAAFVLGAYAWQLLPDKLGLILSRYRFLFLLVVLLLGVDGAMVVGPPLENLLFQGDLKAWLNTPGDGRSRPGWFLLLLPLSLLVTFVLLAQVVNPRLRYFVMGLKRLQMGALDLLKFLAATVFTGLLAFAGAQFLTWCGFDPRGTFVGTYIQRNALIVGAMMGFAIIPIIFTIAEDSLSSVPEHLRSASLACGATRWQTATRIIIPTAMSGLFSAVMIGLGRAVGETMIVLMAAGNTPVLEMNIFNGFRTLSANIAVELPEAVKDSTHYRMLFLAAVTLFAMTFVLNTIAEVIRQRFRKRAYQL